MKQEDERYGQWLEQVRKTQPVLVNPDELTRDILQRVARTPRKRKERGKWMAWFSAIAAGFLFCFMTYETFFYSVSSNVSTRNVSLNISPLHQRLPNWSAGRYSEMNIREKSVCLSGIWKERKAKQREQKRLIHQFMSNNH